MKNHIFLALAALVLAACGPKNESYKPVSVQGHITHVQPMTGLVLWNDLAAEMHATHGSSLALEFSYIQPCRLLTGKQDGKIQYDWTYLEDKLSAAAARGHQMVVRFPLCYPSNRNNCIDKVGGTYVPAYIRALPDYHETFAANPGGDGPTWYPDWSNSELQWFVMQFYTDLAERYGRDPRLAFVEVGFGHWAEYHTYGTEPQFGVNFPTRAYQREFFLHLAKVLPMPWMISVDGGDEYYSDVCTHEQTKDLAFGLFDDTFMHAEHEIAQGDGWNERCWQASGADRWKTGVCGGEISYYTPDDQHNFLNPDGMYGFTWEQAAAKYHMTFVICNDATRGDYFSPERVAEAGIASGYNFKILACETNGTDSRITITNTGIAPIYRDAFITVDGVRAEQSLCGLLPGEECTYTVQAVATPSNVRITSDFILPSQEIEFEAAE